MEKSIKNAFTFMFKDPDWIYKLSILALLSVPSSYISYLNHTNSANSANFLNGAFLLLCIVSMVTSLIVSGYFSKCTQNIIFATHEEANLLPAWEDNFGGFVTIGLKKMLGGLLIGLVILPASLLVIPILIFAFISIALERIFCQEFKISSYFAWRKAFNLIKEDGGRYFLILLTYIPLVLILAVIMLIFMKIPAILMVVLPIITAYYMLVSAYLVGSLGLYPDLIED